MQMKRMIFRVGGMHCKSCQMLIEDALKDIGVNVKADKDGGLVRVNGEFDPDEVRDVIENEGFPVMMQKEG